MEGSSQNQNKQQQTSIKSTPQQNNAIQQQPQPTQQQQQQSQQHQPQKHSHPFHHSVDGVEVETSGTGGGGGGGGGGVFPEAGSWLCCLPCVWLRRNTSVHKASLTAAMLLVMALLVASPVLFLISSAPEGEKTRDCLPHVSIFIK